MTRIITHADAGSALASSEWTGDATHLVGGSSTYDLDVFPTTIDWSGGNVTYVPLNGDIQEYVTAAIAGDTLILASGVYTITSTITINKQLNIMGQGLSGFVTAPVTPSHGTLITSSTAAVTAFLISSDNVRLANFSLNLTGAGSLGINTTNNLKGIVLNEIDVIVTCTGAALGFTIYGSSCVLRNLSFYITSSDSYAYGLWVWNDSSTTQNVIADCYNVTGTVSGQATSACAFLCENVNDANTVTLNLYSCVVKAVSGTALDIAVGCISTTTFNAIVNCYLCTLDGADWDAYQTGSNILALGGSVLVNNKISGTVTYRATMASGNAVIGATMTLATGGITDSTGAISFGDENLSTTGTVSATSLAGSALATPSISLGTAASPGTLSTVVRSDATIVAFDATSPSTQAFGDAAATGTVAYSARRDHKHAMPAVPADLPLTGGTLTGPVVLSGSGEVTIKFRPFIDQTVIHNTAKPIVYYRGLKRGWALPIYADDNEELYITEPHVSHRWNGTSNFTVAVAGYLPTANTDKKFRLQLEWMQHTPGVDVVGTPAPNVVTVEGTTGTWAAYQSFDKDFVIDYDVGTADPVVSGDVFSMRLRRIASSGGTATEIAGSVVVTGIDMRYICNKFASPIW